MRPELQRIGCVIVGRDSDGNRRATSVGRELVAGIAGKLDSVDAPVIGGRPTAGSLHVVTGLLPGPDRSATYVVNCLAPESVSQVAFSTRLATSHQSEVWTSAIARLTQHSADPTRPDVVVASDILLESVRSGAQPRFVPASAASRLRGVQGLSSLRFSFACGPGTNYVCGSELPPTITITARPGQSTIIDTSFLYFSRRIYSLSELAGIWFYDGPDCSNASDVWITMDAQIREMEAQADAMQAATSAVASYACEAQYTDGGTNLCLDLFIMGERASFFIGDNRSFDPNAPYKASRAQIYINPDDCTIRRRVNTSRTVDMGPYGNGPYEPHSLNSITTERVGPDCIVRWKLLTGWCEGQVPGFLCPSIDGSLYIARNGNGGWTASIFEDKFPSRGLYMWRGDHFETISEREETIWLDLASSRRNIEQMRIKRDESLPPGCELE